MLGKLTQKVIQDHEPVMIGSGLWIVSRVPWRWLEGSLRRVLGRRREETLKSHIASRISWGGERLPRERRRSGLMHRLWDERSRKWRKSRREFGRGVRRGCLRVLNLSRGARSERRRMFSDGLQWGSRRVGCPRIAATVELRAHRTARRGDLIDRRRLKGEGRVERWLPVASHLDMSMIVLTSGLRIPDALEFRFDGASLSMIGILDRRDGLEILSL